MPVLLALGGLLAAYAIGLAFYTQFLRPDLAFAVGAGRYTFTLLVVSAGLAIAVVLRSSSAGTDDEPRR